MGNNKKTIIISRPHHPYNHYNMDDLGCAENEMYNSHWNFIDIIRNSCIDRDIDDFDKVLMNRRFAIPHKFTFLNIIWPEI